jgi:predicted GNAT family N-acyltransferase
MGLAAVWHAQALSQANEFIDERGLSLNSQYSLVNIYNRLSFQCSQVETSNNLCVSLLSLFDSMS